MFSVGLTGGGDLNPQIKCDIFQLLKLFPTAIFRLPLEEYKKKYSCLPLGADPSNYFRVRLTPIMDPVSKKVTGAVILPTHQIFNNPNISITPSLPLVKQPAIASTSRPPWNVPPISILPLSYESNKSVLNSKETQKNAKRTASYPISNRIIKKSRPSITKPIKPRKDYSPVISNQVVKHQIKKNDTTVSSINAAKCIPSTSIAVIRSSQEIPCVQSSNEELQFSKPELNCNDDSSHLNINKSDDGISRKYLFLTDNQFKFDDFGHKSGSNSNQENLRINFKNEMFEIARPEMIEDLVIAMGMVMKKRVSKEELETLKQNSVFLKSSKFDWSSETKNVTATSSKTSPASHNNISNSKNQSNQVSINKSQFHTINPQQPTKQTIKISNITKQQSASSNISSKMQHSTIKQIDIKHVSNNQPNNTSLKHNMATTKYIQTSNKQKLSNKQLPMSPKQNIPTLVSTPKKVQNVKPTVTHQSPVKDVNKCIKCKVVSEDEVCAACRMASHLKNVTVTRIETPSTSAIIVPESPIATPIQPIDVPSSPIHSESQNDDSDAYTLSSGEEDNDSVEPIITKVETAKALKKYKDKLTLNPKLLEDKLWQKNLSIKDYFKIEECNSVHIGSFKTIPARCGDMLVCVLGIRMVIRNLEPEPVTIDLQMENIVKIMAFYGEQQSFIIIYTDYLAAVGIQYLLNMNGDNENNFYNPLSKDAAVNKIIWFFNIKRIDFDQLDEVLRKLPKKKYLTLTVSDANKILNSRAKADEENKKCENNEKDTLDPDTVILNDRLGERDHTLKVVDYQMLSSSEFLNDILIEYYMAYVYTHELSDEERSRSYVFSTYFYSVLAKAFTPSELASPSAAKVRHERVRKWTKHVDIFKKDFIFVPINENSHWYMVVICYPHLTTRGNMKHGTFVNTIDESIGRYKMPLCDSVNLDRTEADPNIEDLWFFDLNTNLNYLDKRGINYEIDVEDHLENKQNPLIQRPCILVFDSLCGGPCRARVTATLREWVEEEYINKYNDNTKDFSPNNFKACLVKVPQQTNFYDCGLFALYYYKLFFEKPIVDYTFPIRYLENWFNPDEVSLDSIKRRELNSIIITRMRIRGAPMSLINKLPDLDFSTPKTPPHLVANAQNRPPPPPNPPGDNHSKPSTSQNQPRNPPPSPKFQPNENNNRGHGNYQYYDNNVVPLEGGVDSAEEDVNRQFNANDHYDYEDESSEYDDGEDDDSLLDQAECSGERANNVEPEVVDDDDDEVEEVGEVEEVEDEDEDLIEDEEGLERGEVLERVYRNIPFNEFQRNMLHANNGNVPYVNRPRFVLGNHRVAHANENFQPHRPNNRDVVYNNDDDELHEIVDEEDYLDEANVENHHRHDNHFNHNRL